MSDTNAPQASGHGMKAVITALIANLMIAVLKVIVFIITRSASMLAEATHSFADAANQALLLFGDKQARRAPDRLHPFGYGREQYFYSFLVSLILFVVGGCFAINEAIQKGLHPHSVEGPLWLPVAILIFSLILEAYSFSVAIKETKAAKGKKSYRRFIKDSKRPELIVCLLEDMAAVLGLVVALICVLLADFTGQAIFDAIGSGVIGFILIAVAVTLGVETKSLLIGESAEDEVLDIIEHKMVGEGNSLSDPL